MFDCLVLSHRNKLKAYKFIRWTEFVAHQGIKILSSGVVGVILFMTNLIYIRGKKNLIKSK